MPDHIQISDDEIRAIREHCGIYDDVWIDDEGIKFAISYLSAAPYDTDADTYVYDEGYIDAVAVEVIRRVLPRGVDPDRQTQLRRRMAEILSEDINRPTRLTSEQLQQALDAHGAYQMAAEVPVASAGYTGNLEPTDDDVQKVADKFDAFTGNPLADVSFPGLPSELYIYRRYFDTVADYDLDSTPFAFSVKRDGQYLSRISDGNPTQYQFKLAHSHSTGITPTIVENDAGPIHTTHVDIERQDTFISPQARPLITFSFTVLGDAGEVITIERHTSYRIVDLAEEATQVETDTSTWDPDDGSNLTPADFTVQRALNTLAYLDVSAGGSNTNTEPFAVPGVGLNNDDNTVQAALLTLGKRVADLEALRDDLSSNQRTTIGWKLRTPHPVQHIISRELEVSNDHTEALDIISNDTDTDVQLLISLDSSEVLALTSGGVDTIILHNQVAGGYHDDADAEFRVTSLTLHSAVQTGYCIRFAGHMIRGSQPWSAGSVGHNVLAHFGLVPTHSAAIRHYVEEEDRYKVLTYDDDGNYDVRHLGHIIGDYAADQLADFQHAAGIPELGEINYALHLIRASSNAPTTVNSIFPDENNDQVIIAHNRADLNFLENSPLVFFYNFGGDLVAALRVYEHSTVEIIGNANRTTLTGYLYNLSGGNSITWGVGNDWVVHAFFCDAVRHGAIIPHYGTVGRRIGYDTNGFLAELANPTTFVYAHDTVWSGNLNLEDSGNANNFRTGNAAFSTITLNTSLTYEGKLRFLCEEFNFMFQTEFDLGMLEESYENVSNKIYMLGPTNSNDPSNDDKTWSLYIEFDADERNKLRLGAADEGDIYLRKVVWERISNE